MPLQLAVCELYHPRIHGATANSPRDIAQRYIVRETLSPEAVLRNEHLDVINLLKCGYASIRRTLGNHPDVRNYRAIISHPDYIKLDVVKVDEISGADGIPWTVGCLKTYSIRVLQRKWRSWYKNQQNIIMRRKHPKALRCRETTGKWPC